MEGNRIPIKVIRYEFGNNKTERLTKKLMAGSGEGGWKTSWWRLVAGKST